MSNEIPEFTRGPRRTRTILNNVIRRVRTIRDIVGDGVITVSEGPHGRVIGINWGKLRERIPGLPVGDDGDVFYRKDGVLTRLAPAIVDSVLAFDVSTSVQPLASTL